MIKFNWRRGAKKIAKIRLETNLDAVLIGGILITWYAADHDADELPDDITRRQAEKIVRDVLRYRGQAFLECSFYDDVDGDQEEFDAWALSTVKRCFPEVADDEALNSFFGRHAPEGSR